MNLNLPFSSFDYDELYNISVNIFNALSPDLKSLLVKPSYKDNPNTRGGSVMWFDFQAKKKSDPHLAVWFRYTKSEGRYIEVAINSESKASNVKIAKNVKKNKFWDYLKNVGNFQLRLHKKNILLDRQGRLYGISAYNYEWVEPAICLMSEEKLNESLNITASDFYEKLSLFNPDSYEENSKLKGKPSCDNAIFALCITKYFDYEVRDVEKLAKSFEDMGKLYMFLCNGK
ncbi:MAG: hypothetical protein LWY06_11440 [Firmicutes bacterium]|nr:hypothetical protein [Bacillota bacterium]